MLEYVWKAGFALHGEGNPATERWVSERLLEILRGNSSDVAAGMRRSATLRALEAKERIAVDDCADYLLKYRRYLRYDEYLAAGLPISTGVIEGACRHLVRDRMDITPARAGACLAPKPSSSSAPCAPAATSTPTGRSTRRPSGRAITSRCTEVLRRPPICPVEGRPSCPSTPRQLADSLSRRRATP